MTTLRQLGMKIANALPVDLYLISNGDVVLSPTFGMNMPTQAVYDHKPEGVSAIFDKEGFSLFEKSLEDKQDYMYNVNYAYKGMQVLKAWLIQQNLVLPQGVE